MTKISTLKASNLAKNYKKRQVIKDVELEVKSGQIVGLLGTNGAGKTTTFYIITGLIKPDKGKVLIDDIEITGLPIHKRSKLGLGYLPQDSSIFGALDVRDNIMAILETRSNLNKKQKKHKLQELLEELSITHIEYQPGKALSGGERRRVEIARCLAANPKFVLLDEPFAGIDPISVHELQDLISHLKQKNIGVLITDHNVRETLGICDISYVLHNGTILAKGTSSDIINNPKVKQYYLGKNFAI